MISNSNLFVAKRTAAIINFTTRIYSFGFQDLDNSLNKIHHPAFKGYD